MSTPDAVTRPVLQPWPLLGAGLLLGIAGDLLLRTQGAPGLGMFVWTVCVAGAALALYRRRGVSPSREATALVILATTLMAGLVWRDSEELKVLTLFGAAVCFALPALHAGAAWARRGSVAGYVRSVALGWLSAALGPVPVLARLDWKELGDGAGRGGSWRRAAAGARGVVMAVPLLVVFGALFIAADAVFADMIARVVRIDPDVFASHVVLTGVLAWIVIGCVRGFIAGTELDFVPKPRGGVLGIMEIGTAMTLLNLLFLAFVIVQFRYLFGGSELIEVTPGLTYAEYARRGFFELVFVVMLTLPWLLATDWLLRRDAHGHDRLWRTLTGLQIVLVLAVLASAVRRMQLYQDAYGLTTDRFYATALLALLGFVLLWFVATVLRGRSERFAFGTLVAGLVTLAVLYAGNPDALIARTNIARAADAAADTTDFDAAYATTLSADAVPVLLASLQDLPADARCMVAGRLLERWEPAAEQPLRSWSWSSARAHRAVREHAPELRTMTARPCRDVVASAAGVQPTP